jgi:hypothetical protein
VTNRKKLAFKFFTKFRYNATKWEEMADEQKKIREVASEEVKKEEMAIDNGD